MTTDAIVLGAGIIGVSTAVHLAQRGKSVVLIDRRGPGEETSFGNAGLIQREGIIPYGFPQQLQTILRYALNNRIDAHYHAGALPSVARFLGQYWWNSNAARHRTISRVYTPLIEQSVAEHDALIQAADAQHLIRKDGWTQAFRTPMRRDAEIAAAEQLRQQHGLGFEALDARQLAAREPHLSSDFVGGLRWTDPWSVTDPHALTLAYAALMERLGGRFAHGDAASLAPTATGWSVTTKDGRVEAKDVVVALGPWSDVATKALGYDFPLGVKRGYHMHYAPRDNAVLNGWTMDSERGYFLAPMRRGIRLTTGAEFALRDAPKTPVQLQRAEAVARTMFPLGARLDAEPWMGARPCTPDMLPVIGKAPRHRGVWFAFGHAHHGLTLGPVTGRAVAELVCGETPFIDLHPYRAERFSL